MKRSIMIAGIAGLAMWLTSCVDDEGKQPPPLQEQSSIVGTWKTSSITFFANGEEETYTNSCEGDMSAYTAMAASHLDSFKVEYDGTYNIVTTYSCRFPSEQYLLNAKTPELFELHGFWGTSNFDHNRKPGKILYMISKTPNTLTVKLVSHVYADRNDNYAIVELEKQ